MSISPFLGPRTVIYGVNDIGKAKSFYTKILGVEPYFDQSYYVGYNIGGFELGLDPNAKPIGDSHAGVVAYWGVEDIDIEYKKILAAGGKEHSKVKNVGDDIKVATILDPFGNVFGLIYNPHFK